jgi:hypothetical protein
LTSLCVGGVAPTARAPIRAPWLLVGRRSAIRGDHAPPEGLAAAHRP